MMRNRIDLIASMRGGRMFKGFFAVLLAGVVAGCASGVGGGQSEPFYDYSANALIAPGYPVERIQQPNDFRLVEFFAETNREDPDFSPGASGKHKVTEATAVWVSHEGETAIIGALQLGLENRIGRSYWQPWKQSEGTVQVGNKKYEYLMYEGSYDEVVWYPSTIPTGAPQCGVAVQLQLDSVTRDKRTRLFYSEGIDCEALNTFGYEEKKALRARATRLMSADGSSRSANLSRSSNRDATGNYNAEDTANPMPVAMAENHILGDSVNDDAITGHRYLGLIEARDIGRIDLERLRPTTYRVLESGEVTGEQVVERWKVGATIRETRTFIFDEFTMTLRVNRGVTGRVYGVELESVKMASGEPADDEMIREVQSLTGAMVGPLFAYQEVVLGKPLVVGKRYSWDVGDALSGLFGDMYDGSVMEGIDLSAEGASVYLGVTQTAQGEAAVFREYARMDFETNGVSQEMQSAGWRLIDRRSGALIERDMRMKVTYAMDGDLHSTYERERVELAQD